MKKLFLSLLAALSLHAYGDNVYGMENNDTTTIQIIETSDVHGCFFPYDFINRRDLPGSLARVKTYVDRMRAQYGAENVFLLDNGDILQGQPICYYYNYVATGQTNIAAQCTNYLQYDAQTLGNHDVETGHGVYDKWIRESHAPVLGANVIDTRTGKPYTLPYRVLCKDGKVKVAIIGMITPAIPSWLKENLWSGLRFDDMVATARRTIQEVKDREHPDVIVGLFHSGWDGGIVTKDYTEDASRRVAEEVAGFDVVLFGHDHRPHQSVVENGKGRRWSAWTRPTTRARWPWPQSNSWRETDNGAWPRRREASWMWPTWSPTRDIWTISQRPSTA